MIPYLNVKHLQLRKDVVKAVKEQLFHIYSVKTIDEGIELLTGVPSGKLKAGSSEFEEKTVHRLVQLKLQQFKKEAVANHEVKSKL